MPVGEGEEKEGRRDAKGRDEGWDMRRKEEGLRDEGNGEGGGRRREGKEIKGTGGGGGGGGGGG